MMRLDDFILLLAKKYGRQNQDMHESFEVILNEMKKKLSYRNHKDQYASGASNSSEERDLLDITVSTRLRRYEDLSDCQKRFYDETVKERHTRILNNWKGVIEQYLEYRKPFLVDAYMLNSK